MSGDLKKKTSYGGYSIIIESPVPTGNPGSTVPLTNYLVDVRVLVSGTGLDEPVTAAAYDPTTTPPTVGTDDLTPQGSNIYSGAVSAREGAFRIRVFARYTVGNYPIDTYADSGVYYGEETGP